MSSLKSEAEKQTQSRSLAKVEILGLVLVIASMLGLLFIPETVAGVFNAMVDGAFRSFQNFIFEGKVGIAIIVSVIIGRVLERLGFTDALIRIFVPVMKHLGINSAVIIPPIYNIIGDSNAAGRIAGPILSKAKATKDEQKIAVATTVQSQQTLATFMLGLAAMAMVGINIFPVIVLVIFVPVILTPLLLRFTIYRDTKKVELEELPKFTPNTPALTTIFGAAKEGAELVFLLVVPAGAVVLGLIGGLEYLGIWGPINAWITNLMGAISVHPETGIMAIMVSPTLAIGMLVSTLQEAAVEPRLVLGAFVVICSCFPLQIIFGQIPAIWGQVTDLTEAEAMKAAIVGSIIRLVTAGLVAGFLAPLFIK
ncbi:hypothetical protein [Candidatus Contubernalis alkaliaceticus]|uniref:hypothetical protein n=1 Tax=Candidatus Contubernalis alkaliaceticus TaxID=338645 RepID=UPI001F4BD355|nr:hypothetical protein [Candidatus Contubernalis alkalaceticus]UNC91550.1 hypothetical protein HUE98_05270 [Candidatus Contubernalis alkalaceticus]